MARTTADWIAMNEPVGSGTPYKPKPPTDPAVIQRARDYGATASNPLWSRINNLVSQFDAASLGPGGAYGGSSSKHRDIQKRQLAFQKETGLRDIKQQREEGLKAAINNALQRGIYRSGIREENEALVNRESDEAVSDLKKRIAFALESLKASASGGGGGGGGGGDSPSGLTVDEIHAIAENVADNSDWEPDWTPPILSETGGPS